MKRQTGITAVALFATALLYPTLFGPRLFAQTNSAAIVGTVTDPTGASIAGATVSVVRVETNQKQTTVTNNDGNYSLPFLAVGHYTLSASAPGFQSMDIAKFELVQGQTARFDVHLKIGQISEKVTVEASAVGLQTENATVGTVIDREKVAELPLNGRSFVQLALLTPGVNPVTPGSLSARSAGGSLGQNVGMSANGARDNQNRYYYDGVEAMSLGSYSFSFSLSIDAIQEFKVDSSTYSAADGAAPGGQVNLTTKSGTNDYHAQAWEFNRNDALTALAPFQPYSPNAAPPRLNRNQFGANIGGPVLFPKLYNGKQRTFFFFNWESGRLIQGSFGGTAFVPPVPFRTGDFSSSAVKIYDPDTGLPFPNNIIPTSRIRPFAQKFLTFVPAPNTNEATINYRAPAASAPTDQNQYLARIDHRITDSNTMYGTYIFNQQTVNQVPTFGFDTDNNLGRQQHVVLADIHVFSPSVVNEFRAGWDRRHSHEFLGTTDNPQDDIANLIGIPNVSKDPRNYGPPGFTLGYDVPQVRTIGPSNQHNQIWQFTDNISVHKGNHYLTLGAVVFRRNFSFDEAFNPRGTFTFDGRTTSGGAAPVRENTFASFLLGLATNAALSPDPFSNRMNHFWQSYYAQDDWKLTRNLTLNIGLRYDYFQQPVERGKITNFNLNGAVPGFIVSSQIFRNFPEIADTPNVPAALVNPDRNDWGPRFGFAYRVPHISDMVVRGGYGIYYTQEITNSYTTLTLNPPIVRNLVFSGTYDKPIQVETAFTGQGQTVSGQFGAEGIDPNLRDAYVQQWNFTVEKKLPGKILYDIGYVGSKGTNLAIAYDGNRPLGTQVPGPSAPPVASLRPFQGFGGITTVKSIGNSTYHSLQMKAERRLSNGLSFIAAYTWSKALTTMDQSTVGGGYYSPSIQNIFDLAAEKSPAAFDLRQRFSLAVIYDLPIFAHAHNAAVRTLLGGWQLNAIDTQQTGFAAALSGVGDTTDTGISSRPSVVAGQSATLSNPSRNEWFNTAAFMLPVPGTFGNAARTSIHLPGLNNIDLAANKYFRLNERANFQFRVEMFNFVNHVNLGAPGLSLLTPNTFGVITTSSQGPGATGDQRIVQLGLKFQF